MYHLLSSTFFLECFVSSPHVKLDGKVNIGGRNITNITMRFADYTEMF